MVLFAVSERPADLNKYSVFVQNVTRHLTQGWNNGHQWKVTLYRFGNEPDNGDFWKGTRQDFFDTYAAWGGGP